MRARIFSLLIAGLALLAPNQSGASTSIDCGDDQGTDRLTTSGAAFEFEAPAVVAPELADTRQATGSHISNHRTARFFFVADLAPYEYATLKARIEWADTSDYDLYVLDPNGSILERGDTANAQTGLNFEELSYPLWHCERVSIAVRNWAGLPGQPISLTLSINGNTTRLSCAAADPAPACAGKAAGEAPSPISDDRTRLYLAGDPGQAAMWKTYVKTNSAETLPVSATLVEDRPTTGVSNQHSRALVGFRDALANPFFAHFTHTADAPYAISGAPSAMVWAQSASSDATAKIVADLWADGVLLASSTLTGEAVTNLHEPRPLFFTFPTVNSNVYESLTLQIGMTAVATSAGATGNPADAQMSIYYGSAQFQSRVTLP